MLTKLLAYLRGLNPRQLWIYLRNIVLYRHLTIELLQKTEVYQFKDLAAAEQLSKLTKFDVILSFLAENCTLYSTTGLHKSHSFVIQFLQLFEKTLAPSHTTYVINRLGSYITNGAWGNLEAPAYDDKYGISIGTGTTPPDNEDYVVETKIENGTTSGKMYYNECGLGVTSVRVASPTNYVELPILRTFYNRSGATITVKEVCLTCGTGQYYLLARDAVNVDVPNLYLLIAWYVLRTRV